MKEKWLISIAVTVMAIMGLSIAFAESGGAPSTFAGGGPAQTTEPASIDGYRSAHFGMTETEVRKAIKTDFSVDDPTKAVNDNERTTALIVPGKTLIPDSPPATVSYIFGTTTAKLIQVNVIWGDAGGIEAKKIVPTTNALAAYFLENGSYAKDSLALNQGLSDGTILAFRGADAKGHMIVLQLVPIHDPTDDKKAGKDKPVEFKKAMLRLSYIANSTKPDVFRIEKGKF